MKYINDTIVVHPDFSKFQNIFNEPFSNCNIDSIQLSLNDYFGNSQEIFFNKDGTAGSVAIRANQIKLPTGDYEFTGIKTDNDCILPLNFKYEMPKSPFDETGLYLDNMQIKTNNTGVLYAWYLNGVPFDTTDIPQTNFIGNGLYDVEITNINGCVSRTQKIDFDKGKLLAYPNPFKKQFELFIELPQNQTAIVDIFDPAGRKIESRKIKNGTNFFDFAHYKKGVYILKVRYKERGFTFDTLKMVKI